MKGAKTKREFGDYDCEMRAIQSSEDKLSKRTTATGMEWTLGFDTSGSGSHVKKAYKVRTGFRLPRWVWGHRAAKLSFGGPPAISGPARPGG